MDNLIKYILLFFFYSAAGWCLETTYCSIGEKRFINRGFLTGPLCPIYGTAALVMTILIYNPFRDRPLLVFVLGIILCDLVEYITSFLMEKLFAARWWDYTYEFMNIRGRICLKHSLYWGVISIVFVDVIHPAVENLYSRINGQYLIFILAAVLTVFVLDLINAVRKALDIRKLHIKLKNLSAALTSELNTVKDSIENKYDHFREALAKRAEKVSEFKMQIEDIVYEYDQRITRKNKKKDKQEKKKSLSSRLLYNNPNFERRTRKQIEKLNSLIDDIKANIFENEDMH
ncbi:MAG: putative ABC transporter permease [Oscillospiraceae bacterium]|nr:putative ABC transporter permease [Oscillospiraceae bacterium]